MTRIDLCEKIVKARPITASPDRSVFHNHLYFATKSRRYKFVTSNNQTVLFVSYVSVSPPTIDVVSQTIANLLTIHKHLNDVIT